MRVNKPSGSELIFSCGWKIFDYSFAFHVCEGLLRLSLPGSVLEGYNFLNIHPFLPSCPFYCHIAADNSLL